MNESGVMNGQVQDPLSDEGIAQAQKLAEKFARIPLDEVRSSDLSRTIDTAEYLVKSQNNLTNKQDARLRERAIGEFEGMPLEEIRQIAAAAGMKRGHFSEIDSRVEKSADIVKRFLSRYDEHIINSGYSAVGVVTHGALIRIILAHVIGMAPGDYLDTHTGIENTAINIISIKDGHRRIVTINDFSHI